MKKAKIGDIVYFVSEKSTPKCDVSVVIDVFDEASGYVALRNLVTMEICVTTHANGNFAIPGTWHWPQEDRQVQAGDIVLFVDETPEDYNDHVCLPALVQHAYILEADKGRVHLHIFEAYADDNNAIDAYYSAKKEPGTWHWKGDN